jgi:hypothetical protein
MKKALSVFILTMVCALWNPNTTYATQTFKIGQKTFLLDGKPFVVKAAEMHYPRIPRPYWEHRIQMCKALGMNTICIYVFWNIHEQREGEFNFTENNDVAAFCRLESTYWQTEKGSALPHLLVIDLGSEQTITALEYLPRAEQNAPGCIKDYRIFIY